MLGKWQIKTPPAGSEHVTIAVSGANGGRTVDFRRFAKEGMTLVGMTRSFTEGVLTFAADLVHNIAEGDANYLSVLDEADAYVAREGIDLPADPEARQFDPDPDCVSQPILALDLEQADITTIIWATGFKQDFAGSRSMRLTRLVPRSTTMASRPKLGFIFWGFHGCRCGGIVHLGRVGGRSESGRAYF